jgi:predicted transcriptional regulator of viral defense system
MVMENTILSKNDAELLEDVIAKYGRIVDIDDLYKAFEKHYNTQATRKRVSLLSQKGWLQRIKKGIYAVVTDIGELNALNLSLYTLARTLNKDSYISFENALQYHGMFDQMLTSVAAVTFKRARKYKIKNTEVEFHHIKKEFYFGFTREKADNDMVNISEKEKALLDMLYFSSDVYHAGLVWEKLSEYRTMIDFSKLINYALKFNLKVIRQTGFFLDLLDIDTKKLHEKVKGKNSYSRMSSNASEFNAKWRLYFDSAVIK